MKKIINSVFALIKREWFLLIIITTIILVVILFEVL